MRCSDALICFYNGINFAFDTGLALIVNLCWVDFDGVVVIVWCVCYMVWYINLLLGFELWCR